MKKIFIALLLVFVAFSAAYSYELDEVYRASGDYETVSTESLKIYYPSRLKNIMPRVIKNLSKVRKNVLENFPDQKNCVPSLVITDHDDITTSITNTNLDLIDISLFDEIGAFSTRGYSLERRFAMTLANIMVVNTINSQSGSWLRPLSKAFVPQWYISGMVFYYAFQLNSVYRTRLLDMARSGKLYDINSLSTIERQSEKVGEEMSFQAQSMIAYWVAKYKPKDNLALLRNAGRKPGDFAVRFKKQYGVSIDEAYKSYVSYITAESKKEIKAAPNGGNGFREAENVFARSYQTISANEKLWASSHRYTSETYDLFYQKGKNRPVVLLKNVHPSLLYNASSKEVYIGAYHINRSTQKCLNLYAVSLNGKKRRLVAGRGAFKPLALHDGRVYYTQITNGLASVKSVDISDISSVKTEYEFSNAVLPEDLALDNDCGRLFYTVEIDNFCQSLRCVSLKSGEGSPFEIFNSCGDLLCLKWHNGCLWFASEKDFGANQLFCLSIDDMRLSQYTRLPGGVWDISFNKADAEVITLNSGCFKTEAVSLKKPVSSSIIKGTEPISEPDSLGEYFSAAYKPTFSSNYLSPTWGKDEDGVVLGYYNRFCDRLGRVELVIAPAYGLKSSSFSYYTMLSYRLGQFKLSFSMSDYTIEKTYRSNDYYEREKSRVLNLKYPLNLSTSISVGLDATKRGIAEYPTGTKILMPTMGRDNSFYVKLNHKAIRSEPYANILPRRGNIWQLQYRRGDEFLDGQMNYNSLSAELNRYIPLTKNLILGIEAYVAEDDKIGDVRRPEDLELGNSVYMRAFDDDDINGDSLRYFSVYLSHPFDIRLPNLISWVYNEFSSVKVFFETGDVKKKGGHFKPKYDRGLEINSQLLLLKKVPVAVRAGIASKNGTSGDNFYVGIGFTSALSHIIR